MQRHDKNRRNTQQRQVILEELRRVPSHPTAATLYEQVRRRLPRISLGTVYRNLDLLAEAGTIGRIEGVGGQTRFDGNVDQHDHIRCERCGRLDDIRLGPPDTAVSACQAVCGYEVHGRRLEFFGLCPQCRQLAADA